MAEANVVIESVSFKDGVSEKTGKPWKRLIIKDANGNYYSSFERGLFEEAQRLEGHRATIRYEQEGRFQNLTSIKPAEKPVEEKLGTGEYVKGQLAPTDARRILACSAWNCAAAMAQADLGFEAAQNLANKIFHDLLRKSDMLEDRDIPF